MLYAFLRENRPLEIYQQLLVVRLPRTHLAITTRCGRGHIVKLAALARRLTVTGHATFIRCEAAAVAPVDVDVFGRIDMSL